MHLIDHHIRLKFKKALKYGRNAHQYKHKEYLAANLHVRVKENS